KGLIIILRRLKHHVEGQRREHGDRRIVDQYGDTPFKYGSRHRVGTFGVLQLREGGERVVLKSLLQIAGAEHSVAFNPVHPTSNLINAFWRTYIIQICDNDSGSGLLADLELLQLE